MAYTVNAIPSVLKMHPHPLVDTEVQRAPITTPSPDRLLIATSKEGGAAAKKCRHEEEEGSHRGEILRDLSAETQTDPPPESTVP